MSQNILTSVLFFIWLSFFSAWTFADSFAGARSCIDCHTEIYEQVEQSGHPHKLKQISNRPPSYPSTTSSGVPHPPEGFDWTDISYVIGGFAWKARFMDKEGYVLTGNGRQYNLANPAMATDPQWVAYDSDELSRKPYTCGSCHTTGWQKTGPEGPHQGGLPGIHGTWAEPGVTCEACHGPSAAHVDNPTKVSPNTEENCDSCHSRGDITQIDAKNGLIKHHEQYESLLASPHLSLACGTCHNPHQSTKYNKGGFKGVSQTCKTCHAKVEIKLEAKKDADCQSCHMPHSVTSALSKTVFYQGGEMQVGDIRAHIHRITLDPSWKMFTDDGRFVRVDEQNRAYLTLDHACLSCHTDKSMEWARKLADKIH